MPGKKAQTTSVIFRPPIVTVLGHVDHGKTTLLDTIRKTTIATKEAGGITQHIGAYQVMVSPKDESSSPANAMSRGIPSDNKKILRQRNPAELGRSPQDDRTHVIRMITFIDTPGHEAFAKMRSRGIQVADIAILVVAANDGIMPQTIESIKLIQSAKIPCIIALNKIDLPDIQTEKIKQQFGKLGMTLEEYGGEIPLIPISAKSGIGIDKLLQMILLLAELSQIREETPHKLQAVVIESSLSKQKGPIATIVVKSGTLSVGDEVVCDDQKFRIRALTNWHKQNMQKIVASDSAEILGWQKVPTVGSGLYSKSNEQSISLSHSSNQSISLKTQTTTPNMLAIILKADTTGTMEAITASLPPNIHVLNSGIGSISESDILYAKTVNALVIGFHMKPSENVLKLAESEKVIIKTYTIIYELIEEIDEVAQAAITGNLAPILGEAKILEVFEIKDQKIAGIKVMKGRTARGDQIKLMRNDTEIGRARIKSVRHGKEDITKAEQGMEAGVLFTPQLPLLTGDSIISIG